MQVVNVESLYFQTPRSDMEMKVHIQRLDDAISLLGGRTLVEDMWRVYSMVGENVPKSEYMESFRKAFALWDNLMYVESTLQPKSILATGNMARYYHAKRRFLSRTLPKPNTGPRNNKRHT